VQLGTFPNVWIYSKKGGLLAVLSDIALLSPQFKVSVQHQLSPVVRWGGPLCEGDCGRGIAATP